MTSLENLEPELAEALEELAEWHDEPVLSVIHGVEEQLGENFRLSGLNERTQMMIGKSIQNVIENADEDDSLEDVYAEGEWL